MTLRAQFDRSLMAAQVGDAQAQYTAGIALLRGSVVPRDVEAGRAWLERAIEQRHLPALHALARHDLLAGKLGRGARSGWALLLHACELGDARAQLQVARAIAHGLSIENPAEAATYFERSGLPNQRSMALQLAQLALPSEGEEARALIEQLA